MPSHLPSLLVIEQVLRHTPPGVWAVLAAITLLGLRQMRANVASRSRLTLLPVVLGTFSLWSITSAFGLHAAVLGAWLFGFAGVIAAGLAILPPPAVRRLEGSNIALAGSPWPLVSMLSVFMLRYGCTIGLMLHPGWRHDTVVGVSMALAYGALSGVFAARALRVLRAAGAAATITPSHDQAPA